MGEQTRPSTADTAALLDRIWRAQAPGILAVLVRRLGDLDVAEESLQDAVTEALRHWNVDGVPDNPAGWLVTTAWRKAIDRVRREHTGVRRHAVAGAQPSPVPTDDDRLSLIFACCHPVLAPSTRVALTLHAVSGLSTEQIAAAFLTPTATMAKRLVRGRRTLREAGVRFELPDPDEARDRVPAVLNVVYLVFNEGYTMRQPELTREALDLSRQLSALLPAEPEATGLASLVELHEAREPARFDADGQLVLLEDQDRTLWNRRLIVAALARLSAAMRLDRSGPYQVQAAIAAQHAVAARFADTDWVTIRALYDLLDQLAPSPLVRLNRAVATRYTHGPRVALAEVDDLASQLGEYRLLHAVRGELLRALGRTDEATVATGRAHAMATNPIERDLLARRLSSR